MEKRIHTRKRENKYFLFHVYLPYGRWKCANGREVLFNRYYEAIWERANGVTVRGNRAEWVDFISQSWLFNDKDAPWYDPKTIVKCLKCLKEFGASWEPIAHYADVKRIEERIR